MSRPPEVEAAMSYRNGPLSCVLTMSDGSKRYGHEILAAEVERLEKREKELEADLDAYAPPVLQDGRPILDSFGSKLRRDVRARAEAAEARVAMADQSIDELQAALNTQQARVAELEAQNARLRAALFKLRAAAYHAEIWLTSCLDCKDWMWSEHQHEAATEARDDLKAALNGEEAST